MELINKKEWLKQRRAKHSMKIVVWENPSFIMEDKSMNRSNKTPLKRNRHYCLYNDKNINNLKSKSTMRRNCFNADYEIGTLHPVIHKESYQDYTYYVNRIISDYKNNGCNECVGAFIDKKRISYGLNNYPMWNKVFTEAYREISGLYNAVYIKGLLDEIHKRKQKNEAISSALRKVKTSCGEIEVNTEGFVLHQRFNFKEANSFGNMFTSPLDTNGCIECAEENGKLVIRIDTNKLVY